MLSYLLLDLYLNYIYNTPLPSSRLDYQSKFRYKYFYNQQITNLFIEHIFGHLLIYKGRYYWKSILEAVLENKLFGSVTFFQNGFLMANPFLPLKRIQFLSSYIM